MKTARNYTSIKNTDIDVLIPYKKIRGKGFFFTHRKLHPNKPSFTITANRGCFSHWHTMRPLTYREIKRLSSFPDDYKARSDSIGAYMCGMSVPPKMTEAIATQICAKWLGVSNAQTNS